MKFILIICIVMASAFGFSSGQNVSKMRDLFTKVDKDEKFNLELQKITQYATTNTPIAYGYKALYYFMNAKYEFWPTDKLENFAQGKNRLESVIQLYPNEPELRLIRYSVQYNVPSLLNYKDRLEEDRTVLKRAVLNSKYKNISTLIQSVLNKYP